MLFDFQRIPFSTIRSKKKLGKFLPSMPEGFTDQRNITNSGLSLKGGTCSSGSPVSCDLSIQPSRNSLSVQMHHSGKATIDFGSVFQWSGLVTGHDCLQICFWMINSIRINKSFFILHLYIIYHSMLNPLNFGVKRPVFKVTFLCCLQFFGET